MSFELEKLPNGDLKLKIVPDEYEQYRDWDDLMRHGSDNALVSLMDEGYIGNGWDLVTGSDTGDLTSAPMICEDMTVTDDGDKIIFGDVWWFPRYVYEDPVETLRDEGAVIFKLGHKAGELVPAAYKLKEIGPDITEPHGLCWRSRTCREHAADKRVPSCKRGKGRVR